MCKSYEDMMKEYEDSGGTVTTLEDEFKNTNSKIYMDNEKELYRGISNLPTVTEREINKLERNCECCKKSFTPTTLVYKTLYCIYCQGIGLSRREIIHEVGLNGYKRLEEINNALEHLSSRQHLKGTLERMLVLLEEYYSIRPMVSYMYKIKHVKTRLGINNS